MPLPLPLRLAETKPTTGPQLSWPLLPGPQLSWPLLPGPSGIMTPTAAKATLAARPTSRPEDPRRRNGRCQRECIPRLRRRHHHHHHHRGDDTPVWPPQRSERSWIRYHRGIHFQSHMHIRIRIERSNDEIPPPPSQSPPGPNSFPERDSPRGSETIVPKPAFPRK